MNAAEVITVY